jgi:hypothetical protein
MNSFIFITTEGHTFQPGSESTEPDIENCQVIGFAEGSDDQNAFENLIRDNPSLPETTFDELICFELRHPDYWKNRSYFHLRGVHSCP